MDVVKESQEERYVLVKLANRSKLVKVFVKPFSNVNFWRITYEDGTPLPELSGSWTDKRSALLSLKNFEITSPMSKKEYQDKVMGLEGKEPPVLKTKGRRKAKHAAASSENG